MLGQLDNGIEAKMTAQAALAGLDPEAPYDMKLEFLDRNDKVQFSIQAFDANGKKISENIDSQIPTGKQMLAERVCQVQISTKFKALAAAKAANVDANPANGIAQNGAQHAGKIAASERGIA